MLKGKTRKGISSLPYRRKERNIIKVYSENTLATFSLFLEVYAPMGTDEGQTQKGGHKKVWRGIECTWQLSTDKEQEKLKC